MKFITDFTWQVLCLLASATWLSLFLREVYRFRLLRSRFGPTTAILALVLVLAWIVIFIAMVFTSGLLSGILTYVVLITMSCLLFTIMRRKRHFLFHPESLAQADYEKAMYKSIIEEVTCRADIQQILTEYGQQVDFLTSFMQRLISSGSSAVLRKLNNISHVKYILEIYSREDWTDNDKFIAASNYLEYGKRNL